MEVMGLMLGQFVDDYTVNCIDVFAMPQSGTGVSVEAVDPVFQTKMLDMLKQTGRPEVRGRVGLARQGFCTVLDRCLSWRREGRGGGDRGGALRL